MEVNLVTEAFKFMLLGMGVVFSFLVILIFVLKAQTALITKYFPEKEKNIAKKPQKSAASNDSAKTAAIIAAVQHHKNLKG
ncbi:OadG family protein [Poseidonibacter lekithochrous]|uniref:OadG family protein n=1 Tax=Poseidonibacter lekithochrous TaxID=1904463 RepID=UPI000D33E610|nr:OadG family transporter subunit [Poseidonibacter lekithochrous]